MNKLANTPMVEREGWFCGGADFDCEEPYLLMFHEDHCDVEEKVPVPKSVAYYLRTHFCGSRKMHEELKEDGRREIRNKLKNIMGIE